MNWLPEPPEHIKAALEEQQAHMRMHVQDNSHAVKQLLDELNEDQLKALDLILHNVGNPEGVNYFHGRVEAALQYRFGVCPCGEDHDPSKEFDQAPLPSQVAPRIPAPERLDRAELMDQYGMAESEGNFIYCKNCGQQYASLEDRMLRPPGIEGCSGCQQKSAWG